MTTTPITESYLQYIARVGGMITCGEHLGVMVGPEGCRVPNGWIFVPLEQANETLLREAVDLAQRGRAAWPAKA